MSDSDSLLRAMLNAEDAGELGEAKVLAKRIIEEYPGAAELEAVKRVLRPTVPDRRQHDDRASAGFALTVGIIATLLGLLGLLLLLSGGVPVVLIFGLPSLAGVILVQTALNTLKQHVPFPSWAIKLSWATLAGLLLILVLSFIGFMALLGSSFAG
jgi:hypothetical protein